MKTRRQYKLQTLQTQHKSISPMNKKQPKGTNKNKSLSNHQQPHKKIKKQIHQSTPSNSHHSVKKGKKKKNISTVKSISNQKSQRKSQRKSQKKSQKKNQKKSQKKNQEQQRRVSSRVERKSRKEEQKMEQKKSQRSESKKKKKQKDQQKPLTPNKNIASINKSDKKKKDKKDIDQDVDNKLKDHTKDQDVAKDKDIDKDKDKVKDNDKNKDKDKDKDNKKDQIKKIIVKGAAPVDEHFNIGKDFHVLVQQDKVYSITLNQSNISHNNNKYYNLQILQNDKNSNINYFFTRWGRVGTPGQKRTNGPYSVNVAIRQFNAKFQQKHVKGQYRQIQLNYGDDESEQQSDKQKKIDGIQPAPQKQSDFQQSKLPKPVKNLISLIFDLGMMNKQMKQIGFNVNKMPLGKLSKDNIKKGFNILKQLYDQLQHKNRQNIIQNLTNDFYSYIPHDVGFKNMKLYKLDSLKKVKDKLQMLQSLSQIKVATQILKRNQQGNKIDNHYKTLNRKIQPIQPDSSTFKLINDYLQTTHALTHRYYDLELVNLFELHSEMEDNRFTKTIDNKTLLWHGSRLTNFVGILSQGLRIAPPEAPVTGYMFGKGVYFADMSSKSANYCFTNPDNNTGILLLCEVALGTCNQKMHADYNASNLPDGKHSTKGVGRTAPKKQNFQTLDGMIIPMGPGQQTNILSCSLQYNQFIVYDISQIRIRYLLRVKFNYTNR